MYHSTFIYSEITADLLPLNYFCRFITQSLLSWMALCQQDTAHLISQVIYDHMEQPMNSMETQWTFQVTPNNLNNPFKKYLVI